LDNQNYKDSNILVETEDNTTKISIRTKVENDEKVNELSSQIQNLLIEKSYISTKNEIISQSITGPSVGNYMQKTAKQAIIIGLALMAIYMIFSFAGIRKSINPTTLAMVTIVTMIFDVSIPA
jgi:preprotein translocase subunit SecF